MFEVYKGESKSLPLTFTTTSGTPFNLSGYSLGFSASPTYRSPPVISGCQTGYVSAVAGTMVLSLTTGQTNVNPFDYIAQFSLISGNNVSIYMDILRVLPSIPNGSICQS